MNAQVPIQLQQWSIHGHTYLYYFPAHPLPKMILKPTLESNCIIYILLDLSRRFFFFK